MPDAVPCGTPGTGLPPALAFSSFCSTVPDFLHLYFAVLITIAIATIRLWHIRTARYCNHTYDRKCGILNESLSLQSKPQNCDMASPQQYVKPREP